MINRTVSLAAAAALAACAAPKPATTPTPKTAPSTAAATATPSPAAPATYPGIDIAHYPGDAAMQTWKTSSPFKWTGFYLAAACHSDSSWSTKRYPLHSAGWGTAIIYVGQQDWGALTNPRIAKSEGADSVHRAGTKPVKAATNATGSPAADPACSEAKLTSQQGATDAEDAMMKAWVQGFPDGSTIFLDVEGVTTVSPALLAYVNGWLTSMRTLNRYRAGLYVTLANAPAFYSAAQTVARSGGRGGAAQAGAPGRGGAGRGGAAGAAGAGRGGAAGGAAAQAGGAAARPAGAPGAAPGRGAAAAMPVFWIAGGTGFSLTSKPADIGLPYASVWQGQLQSQQQFGNVPLTVDVNVATKASPSAP